MQGDDSILLKTNLLLIRSLLIKHSEKQIIDYLGDENIYFGFLETISNMLDINRDFLLLKDYLSKTQYIIKLGSEKFKTKGDVREKENGLIVDLNDIVSINNKEEVITSYLSDEIIMREYLPYTGELLFNSMAGDYYIIKEIQKQKNEFQNLSHLPARTFLASTSFLMCFVPELYENDPICVKMTEEYLEDLKKRIPELKMYTKKIKKRLSNFK